MYFEPPSIVICFMTRKNLMFHLISSFSFLNCYLLNLIPGFSFLNCYLLKYPNICFQLIKHTETWRSPKWASPLSSAENLELERLSLLNTFWNIWLNVGGPMLVPLNSVSSSVSHSMRTSFVAGWPTFWNFHQIWDFHKYSKLLQKLQISTKIWNLPY